METGWVLEVACCKVEIWKSEREYRRRVLVGRGFVEVPGGDGAGIEIDERGLKDRRVREELLRDLIDFGGDRVLRRCLRGVGSRKERVR